mmetsp:Transcript_35404/g.93330  ORF Transcript_35404/g.93330 Transcript_35404/m.93330 type:complete len:129 (+) Transcript_35404:52-438(+)|eukprot:CAMPEP_0115765406 /NCGR_PEP_ID=MMETSP0272-20121206/102582_1 /TAXON_ID=71861 /ORGANISM="Scrippsiella trochoidea, Strain CCMP3099" /LENGTH=128 /DNA_ID=CAMNT_0003211269 /DNA_START=31 /DNA_END=417 /DNA_ORIENTATION=+
MAPPSWLSGLVAMGRRRRRGSGPCAQGERGFANALLGCHRPSLGVAVMVRRLAAWFLSRELKPAAVADDAMRARSVETSGAVQRSQEHGPGSQPPDLVAEDGALTAEMDQSRGHFQHRRQTPGTWTPW